MKGGIRLPDIIAVRALQNYRVEVALSNGSTVLLNLESKIETSRFCPLKDEELFKKVTTDGEFIRWTDLIEISATEVCDIAKSNLGRLKL